MLKNLDRSPGVRFTATQHDALTGETRCFSLAQLAEFCDVEPEWLQRNLAGGVFPGVEHFAGQWRVAGDFVLRARLMRQLERDFKTLLVRHAGCVADFPEVAAID
ncbi:MAG: MerR family transcriptional regulator [Azonexus sp.]|nr:MerR family transcriptional regulator [Azonexus sp.]MDZ4315915.1 MerR family transcriptional regulator [Azonexus sp.]